MAGQATVKKVMKTLGTEGTKGIVNQAVNANPELAHALVDNDVAAYAVGEGSNEVLIYDDNESIIKIGQIITNYQPYMNTFVPALVNQIGMVAIERMMWMNKWSKFYQGQYEGAGSTVQEIFVDICDPHSYNPSTAEEELFKRELPNLMSAYHMLDFQKFYKVTVERRSVRQAFYAWAKVNDLIANILAQMWVALEYDVYQTWKYMTAKYIVGGHMAQVSIPAQDGTKEAADGALKMVKEYSTYLDNPSRKFNAAGVMNVVDKSEQQVIINAKANADISVETWAQAFNLPYAQFVGNVTEIDSFSNLDEQRLALIFENDDSFKQLTPEEKQIIDATPIIVFGPKFFQIYTYDRWTDNVYNAQGAYTNELLHNWMIFSISPFEQAIAFTSAASTVTGVTVSPTAATISAGQDITLTATVAGSGIYSRNVQWTMEGATKSGTVLTGNRLHVASDEPSATAIKVTATSLQDSSKKATATITVS